MRCASARAVRTACGEQQLLSPSLPGSDHSCSVTATTSSPRAQASCAATALSTPPLIATSVRPAARGELRSAVRGSGAERGVERVTGELGGVHAAGRERAERVRQTCGETQQRVEQGRSADQLDHSAARRTHGGAAAGLEAGVGHAVALDANCDAHGVAADRPAGRTGVRSVAQAPASARRREMVVERREVQGGQTVGERSA